jgi:hypothetical protein
MMKSVLLLLVLLLTVLLGGCGLNLQPPSSLMKSPKVEKNEQALKEQIKKDSLYRTRPFLLTPKHSEEKRSIYIEDFDGDGEKNEAVFFYKNEKKPFEIKMVFYQKKEQWEKVATKTIQNYGEITDLSPIQVKGQKAMLLAAGFGYDGISEKKMHIYRFSDSKIDDIFQTPYTRTIAADLDEDGSSEIITLSLQKGKEFTARLFKADDGVFVEKSSLKLDSSINGIEQMKAGYYTKGKKGVFVDVGVGAHSASTYVLGYEEGKLIMKLDAKNEDAIKSMIVYSEDVNENGIIEIGKTVVPKGWEKEPFVSLPWFVYYYELKEDGSLKEVAEHYPNYEQGYELTFPKEWFGLITIARSTNEHKLTIERVKDGKNLFTLYRFTNKEWESQSKSYIEIENTLKHVYAMKAEEERKYGSLFHLLSENIRD